MSLNPGTKLGPYEILAPLGAGGMGEVYKAKDTRLDRTVAIKVLPSHVASHPEVRQRFEREARAVSSLNHPHICTLHDIGSENGIDFMVMEHIEGDTLADRLKKGALPLDQALQRGIEIADALDKAHRHGVVHRDLKPGNIMLTKSGAKLLDFGLAKMTVEQTNAGGLSALPTEAKPLTQEGSILGTFQYMAPEQLEGKEADARADLFAFGAVLYEMLTGRKAFEGESQASLITAIMSAEPAPISDLQPLTPFALERLVQRCLAKDPEDRWQSARDLTLELGWIRDKGDADVSTTAPTRSRARLTGALALLLTAAIVGVAVHRFTRPDAPPVTRFRTEADELSVTMGQFVKITPDGRTLVYRGEQEGVSQLYRRTLDEIEGTPLPGTENANNLFVSPDSEWAGFFQAEDMLLRKVPLSGGVAVTIAELPVAARGASWGDDDTIVFGSDGGGLWQIPARGGEPQKLTTPAADHEHNRPFHLPGATGVLLTVWSGGASKIAVLPRESNEPRVLLEGTTPQLTASGHLVFQREGGLWAVSFDSHRLEVEGAPVPVVDGVQLTGNTAAQFALSHNGTLVYVPPDVGAAFRLVGVDDRDGRVTPLSKNLEAARVPRLSPDENRVAVEINSPATGFDLWLHDIERGTRSRLTVDGGTNPVWSPGGVRIAFLHYRTGELRTISADGSGETEVLYQRDAQDSVQLVASSWSTDGRFLALTTRGGDIFVMALGGEPEPYLVTEFVERNPMFSPDGRFLAYVSDETGRSEVYVRQFPGPGGKWTLSTDGGSWPVWSKDGRELFYREGNRIMAVSVQTEPAFSADAPRVALDVGFSTEPAFDVFRHGERFLMIQRDASYKRSLVVVLNWFEEMKRVVPRER